MYIRNLQQEKGIENIFGAVRANAQNGIWKEEVRSLVCGRN
jgi:hypothetical protein